MDSIDVVDGSSGIILAENIDDGSGSSLASGAVLNSGIAVCDKVSNAGVDDFKILGCIDDKDDGEFNNLK